MSHLTTKLLGIRAPLPESISKQRANCFNAVQLYWADTEQIALLGPEQFIGYLHGKFSQIEVGLPTMEGDVSVVWSRNASVLPVGKVSIEMLIKKESGYPFGLVIEHAFVHTDLGLVFQKRDPTETGIYEIIEESVALAPYCKIDGFEITRHRRI